MKFSIVGLVGNRPVGTILFEGEKAIQSIIHTGMKATAEINKRINELLVGCKKNKYALESFAVPF
ncbi:MAG: hypothetical protein ACTSSF_12350, partial [Candidatus Heimdallarchaeaceae archaeon]